MPNANICIYANFCRYSIFLTSAASAFQDKESIGPGDWVVALRSGLDAVMLYGGAEPGDRTLASRIF